MYLELWLRTDLVLKPSKNMNEQITKLENFMFLKRRTKGLFFSFSTLQALLLLFEQNDKLIPRLFLWHQKLEHFMLDK